MLQDHVHLLVHQEVSEEREWVQQQLLLQLLVVVVGSGEEEVRARCCCCCCCFLLQLPREGGDGDEEVILHCRKQEKQKLHEVFGPIGYASLQQQ